MAPGRRPTVNQNPPVNRLTNRNNLDINSGINTQMLNQLIAIRVTEALAAAAVTHAAKTQEETNRGSNSSQNKTCNYKEFRAVMHENFCESVDDTTLTLALLLVTTMERQDIRPKTAELHLIPQPKENPKAKEDKEAMSLILDVVRKDTTRTSVQTMGIKAVGIKFEATCKTLRTIKGRIKGTLRGITKHQPVLKEDARHLAEYTAYVPKLW
ncbi:hypothetical protein Tco_0368936 [Tanacetum coccineum]